MRAIFAARVHLREVAIARGLLPDPATGEYGALPADDILEAVDKVAKATEPMEIVLRVARDVHTTEPLLVRLEVRPASG